MSTELHTLCPLQGVDVTPKLHTVWSMANGREPEDRVDLARLLGRDYWLIRSIPNAGTDQDAVRSLAAQVGEQVRKVRRTD